VKSQALPSQVALAWAGGAQGVQEVVPQLAGSLSETQLPLQSWVPLSHTPLQDLPSSRQTPAHSVVRGGHFVPHMLPLHVASPPVGAGQGEQAVPQLCGLSLGRHAVPHR
jgi:hypothetical protein